MAEIPKIVVATWNLQTCGPGKLFVAADVIANVILENRIDILALQEIGTTGDDSKLLTNGMMNPVLDRLGESYVAFISEAIGTGYKGSEVSAFIFRKEAVEMVDDFELDAYESLLDDVSDQIYSHLAHLADSKRVRIRKHGVCTFKCKASPDMIFTVINAHLHSNEWVARVQFEHIVMDHWSSEPVIILGDFNIETGSVISRLEDGMTLIEAAKPTTSKKTLDHIVLWPSASKECAFSLRPTEDKARVVPFDKLIVPGIPSIEFSSDPHGYVSDHCPVFTVLELVPKKAAEAKSADESGGAGMSGEAARVIRKPRKKISKKCEAAAPPE